MEALFALALAGLVAVSLMAMGAIALCSNLGMDVHRHRNTHMEGKDERRKTYDLICEEADFARRETERLIKIIGRYFLLIFISLLVVVVLGLALPSIQWLQGEFVPLLILYLTAFWAVFIIGCAAKVGSLAINAIKLDED